MSKIKKSLEKIFKDERIVFWYDEKEELREEYEKLELANVAKIEVNNDEFGIKYRITRLEPKQKFLLYFDSVRPANIENWLFDLYLANYEFRTDQSSIILQELGLEYEFKELIKEHIQFFKSSSRMSSLKSILHKDDRNNNILIKMIAVICKSGYDLDSILFSLFAEVAKNKSKKYSEIEKYNLTASFWKEVEMKFAYSAESPTLMDLLISIFKTNFYSQVKCNEQFSSLNKESLVFVNRWKDSVKNQGSFEIISKLIANQTGIEKELNIANYDDLQELDIYSAIDKKILFELKNHILNLTLPLLEVKNKIYKRECKYWYKEYQDLYQALKFSIDFLEELKCVDLKINSFDDGVNKYINNYYKLDTSYRKVVFHLNNSSNTAFLADIADEIEKKYSNSYLLTLSDNWQKYIDTCDTWGEKSNIINQNEFYNTYPQKYRDKENKIFIIISDAMRYEIGVELLEKILEQDRFQATLKPMLSSIPSYTQLGMASLLPHNELTFDVKSKSILVDGKSSQGTENRSKILQKKHSRSIAIQADKLLAMNSHTDGRELSKQNDIVYIYQNGIDKVGDSISTESNVFNAVNEECLKIIKLLKHLANMNMNNVIITADHGFIYQNTPIHESDFATYDKPGNNLIFNRRFIISEKLKEQLSFKKFTGKQVNLNENIEVLIPKSINRLKVQASGSRFVHGGASLQEIIIPVIEVNKKRVSDVNYVDIDVLNKNSNISSNQIPVNLYQKDAVEDKLLALSLRIGFYSKTGMLISNQEIVNFNSDSSETRLRETKLKFIFSNESEQFNNQDISLRLEEKIKGTSQYKLYKEYSYHLMISFLSDF